MVLTKQEIVSELLILDPSEKRFESASYTLTIDKILDMDGNDKGESYKLAPQGMVYVIFREKILLQGKKRIIAFAHVKTTLTKRGIMATNIGVIDPGYVGYISTLLINFGNTDFSVVNGDPGLRVTFHRLSEVVNEIAEGSHEINDLPTETKDEYIRQVKGKTDFLDDKFLNLNKVRSEVTSSVLKSIMQIGMVFTVGSFLVALFFQFKNSQEKDIDREVRLYKTSLGIVENNVKLLEQKIDAQKRIIEITDSVVKSKNTK